MIKSINMSDSICLFVEKQAEKENRSFSNYIETLIKKEKEKISTPPYEKNETEDLPDMQNKD
jgi:predicted CopG family antitoxin